MDAICRELEGKLPREGEDASLARGVGRPGSEGRTGRKIRGAITPGAPGEIDDLPITAFRHMRADGPAPLEDSRRSGGSLPFPFGAIGVAPGPATVQARRRVHEDVDPPMDR